MYYSIKKVIFYIKVMYIFENVCIIKKDCIFLM